MLKAPWRNGDPDDEAAGRMDRIGKPRCKTSRLCQLFSQARPPSSFSCIRFNSCSTLGTPFSQPVAKLRSLTLDLQSYLQADLRQSYEAFHYVTAEAASKLDVYSKL